MALYEMTAEAFRPLGSTSLQELRVRERSDLQRLLRGQIEVLGDDLYVLTEEFGEWEDSRRRIDLLAVDRDANLVVIELKRTSDGGHMELQAIRYAAMISTMTFERAVQIHAQHLSSLDLPADRAQTGLLEFLGWEEPDEDRFGQDVRIMLVSEDFGKELTTAVLWLREREIDIRCVRLRPYLDGEKRLIDVQQIIPLPEANDYQIQIREKEQVGRKIRAQRHDLRIRFWEGLVALCRQRKTRHGERKPGTAQWLGGSTGKRGLGFNYVIVQEETSVELYIDRGETVENKRIFDQLLTRRAEIEHRFGGPLTWERLDQKQACRICHLMHSGGYRSSEDQWPTIQTVMIDAMTQLETALQPEVDALQLG
ncbi:MAG: DUF4268 domain-containing protein [Planctomycetaceae bacterium]|jgi:hypothetical protein